MASLRFAALKSRPTAFLDLTSVTLDEFPHVIPPFEAAFHAHMAARRLDGKPRTARQCTVDKNCPLPTPEDRLLCILVYLKTSTLQVVQGQVFGMGQSKAHQWIHVLFPALLAALRTLGDAPARTLTALAQRLGVSDAAVATMVASLAAESDPVAAESDPVAAESGPVAAEPNPTVVGDAVGLEPPLVPMMGRNGVSAAPRTRLNRRAIIAARQSATRSKISC
jgi:hypothetical protein